MPNSGTSRPSSSDSGCTRMLFTLFTIQENYESRTERPDCVQRRSHQLTPELPSIAVNQSGDSLPACPR